MLRGARRNLFLLALCQALFMTGSSMVLTVTALAGEALWPGSGLATLPISLQFVMTMATTVPASFMMRRFGRRTGFQVGASIGILAGLICVVALMGGHFVLFCVGSALVGVVNGFALYYRFAAADCADEENRSRAISLVLAGGVVAAFSGPNLARITVDALGDVAFTGSFAAFAGIQVVTISLLVFVNIPGLSAGERKDQGRPLVEILRIPAVAVAILAGVAGYSSMTLVMTSTPLAMDGMGHGFGDTAFVIQWHVFAMFAPSFVTGHLIKRFGVLPVIVAGACFILACVAVNQMGHGLWQFTMALMALGIGWNFMFVGGTSMLTGAITRPEQAKVQGINDFLVFGAVALGAMSGGILHQNFGWEILNYAVVPGIAASLVAALWFWQAHLARRAG
ncbi:MAG: MFS transporter [Alphaproteobacteria bacterium]|nr:MFS transporter [Alphaproteobacteria bacterium]